MDRTTNPRLVRLFVLLPLLYFLAILVKTSWICDDAYITFRTVDNFVSGFGPRWNVADRVQTYTNPLWMLVVSAAYAFTREIYWTVTALMIAASLGAVAIFSRRVAVSTISAALGVLILATSKAFTDYSTSGLENPLTHLLTAAFLAVYFSRGARDLPKLSAILALAMVNRMDTALLLAPAVVAVAWGRPRGSGFRTVLLGLIPFWAWEAFSILYYGFPFPNPAYAKLGAGIGSGALVAQGVSYLWNAVRWDPLTPLAILSGLVLSARGWMRVGAARDRAGAAGRGGATDGAKNVEADGVATRDGAASFRSELPIGIGIVLYLLYVVRIGGDFMSGRFLAVPLLCAVALLGRRNILPGRALPVRLAPLAAVVALGLASIDPPLLSGPQCGIGRENLVDEKGVSDERAYYYQGCGLLRAFDGCRLPCHFLRTRGLETRKLGRQLITAEAIGLVGFYAGPGPHFVDFYGLADPFIARQPLKDRRAWRIGHFVRDITQDYLDSIKAGENVIRDARRRKLYDDLLLITRGPILSSARIGAIARVNLGGI